MNKKVIKEMGAVFLFITFMAMVVFVSCSLAGYFLINKIESTNSECFYHEKIGEMKDGEIIYDTIYVECPIKNHD